MAGYSRDVTGKPGAPLIFAGILLLLTIAVLTLASPAGQHPVAWVPLLFWCGHYAYRTVLFPALMRPSHNTFPAQLVLFAVLFNVLNGYINARWISHFGAYGSEYATSFEIVTT